MFQNAENLSFSKHPLLLNFEAILQERFAKQLRWSIFKKQIYNRNHIYKELNHFRKSSIFSYYTVSKFKSKGCFRQLRISAFQNTPYFWILKQFCRRNLQNSWDGQFSKNRNLTGTIFSKNLTIFTKVQFSHIIQPQNSKVRGVLKSWKSKLSKGPLTFECWSNFIWEDCKNFENFNFEKHKSRQNHHFHKLDHVHKSLIYLD